MSIHRDVRPRRNRLDTQSYRKRVYTIVAVLPFSLPNSILHADRTGTIVSKRLCVIFHVHIVTTLRLITCVTLERFQRPKGGSDFMDSLYAPLNSYVYRLRYFALTFPSNGTSANRTPSPSNASGAFDPDCAKSNLLVSKLRASSL